MWLLFQHCRTGVQPGTYVVSPGGMGQIRLTSPNSLDPIQIEENNAAKVTRFSVRAIRGSIVSFQKSYFDKGI